MEEEKEMQKSIKSKDKKINKEGRKLVKELEEAGWSILNGNIIGDEEGEYTFTGGRGDTVIDYIIAEVGEEIKKLNEKVRRVIEEGEKKEREGERRYKERWNEECEEKKKEVRQELRKWRKGDRYREVKREYKEMCERKKKEEGEKWMREAGEAKIENKVWELINRERRKRKGVDEGIQVEEWKEHFMGLLGGVEERVMRGQERRGRREKEQDIEWEEDDKQIKRTINKLDLKAAFDTVDREVLIKTLRERGIRKGLVERVEEVIRETKSRVRAGEDITDLEEVLTRGGWGGVRVGARKIFSLAYADDMALVAEEEEGMRAIIAKMESYLDGKRLEVNVEKTKVMVFRRGGGRRKSTSWRWKGKVIEEVKEMKYLGYIFQANGRQKRHIRDRTRKAMGIAVLGYGAEIWGWKEREKIERVKEKFLRWILGVDWRTPWYMIREEMQRDKLRGRAARRASNFEKELEEGKRGGLTRKYLEEIKKNLVKNRAMLEWERERKEFFREKGSEIEKLAWKRENELPEYEIMENDEREAQREERRRKIENSRYNMWYKRIKGKGLPRYLKERVVGSKMEKGG
ncbi:hypothetical protein RF55_15573 [Lasius niger]|uniref:Reverse transcriptase domain-containing protein n=1 Tax=Lasius niger TaxID=67767 RepID=A0A0J7MZ43_LASNI|nr:hypothetical protein RF55_15573 [Lasius niger]